MHEEYLHYLFKNHFFPNTFRTVSGESLTVVKKGIHNHNAGPDFLEAEILYDYKVWVGQIEFHVKSSDWNKHGHQTDSKYDNVIAHFVFEHNQPIFIGAFEVPTVEVRELINNEHYNHYLKFKNAKTWIACASQLHLVNDFDVFQQKEKALINRVIRKSDILLNDVKQLKGNQHQAFWIALGKVFGGNVNAETFASLVRKIQAYHLAHLNYDLTDIEAYCFGLAGFLDHSSYSDDYFDLLKSKFQYQKKLFDLTPLPSTTWKFSRMRPGNFPTVRIAQFAALLVKTEYSYKWFEPKLLTFLTVDMSKYWQHHYQFGKKSVRANSGLTSSFKSLITINAYLPFMFARGLINDQHKLKERAIDALSEIKSESNSIIKRWKALGVSCKTAFDSQALIEQKNEFCNQYKCLQCQIGRVLLNFNK